MVPRTGYRGETTLLTLRRVVSLDVEEETRQKKGDPGKGAERKVEDPIGSRTSTGENKFGRTRLSSRGTTGDEGRPTREGGRVRNRERTRYLC